MLKLKANNIISVRKVGSTSETSQTAKEDEMVMGTNQAYETVEIHYHSACRNRPQASEQAQENATGEPVYENQQHL